MTTKRGAVTSRRIVVQCLETKGEMTGGTVQLTIYGETATFNWTAIKNGGEWRVDFKDLLLTSKDKARVSKRIVKRIEKNPGRKLVK